VEIKDKLKRRLREYHYGIWFLFIFLASLGIGIYITRWMISGSFQVGVKIPYAEDIQYFSIRTGYRFLQPLFLGPIFGIIYYILMRLLLARVNKEEGYNRYYIFAIEICVVILIIINCIAHVFHLGMEYVNALDKTDGAAFNSEYREMFVYAWYLDEWLGHALIQATYFGYLILAILGEILMNPKTKMLIDEYFFSLLTAYGISIINGYAAIPSESGFLILFMQCIFVLIALIVIFVKKIDVRCYPILFAMLISTIFILYFNIIEIMEDGIQSTYPFW
jgi:hypothetical protein